MADGLRPCCICIFYGNLRLLFDYMGEHQASLLPLLFFISFSAVFVSCFRQDGAGEATQLAAAQRAFLKNEFQSL